MTVLSKTCSKLFVKLIVKLNAFLPIIITSKTLEAMRTCSLEMRTCSLEVGRFEGKEEVLSQSLKSLKKSWIDKNILSIFGHKDKASICIPDAIRKLILDNADLLNKEDVELIKRWLVHFKQPEFSLPLDYKLTTPVKLDDSLSNIKTIWINHQIDRIKEKLEVFQKRAGACDLSQIIKLTRLSVEDLLSANKHHLTEEDVLLIEQKAEHIEIDAAKSLITPFNLRGAQNEILRLNKALVDQEEHSEKKIKENLKINEAQLGRIETLEKSVKFSKETLNQGLSKIKEIWLEHQIAEINDSSYGCGQIYELYELRKQQAIYSLLAANSDVLTEEEVSLIKQKTEYIKDFEFEPVNLADYGLTDGEDHYLAF